MRVLIGICCFLLAVVVAVANSDANGLTPFATGCSCSGVRTMRQMVPVTRNVPVTRMVPVTTSVPVTTYQCMDVPIMTQQFAAPVCGLGVGRVGILAAHRERALDRRIVRTERHLDKLALRRGAFGNVFSTASFASLCSGIGSFGGFDNAYMDAYDTRAYEAVPAREMERRYERSERDSQYERSGNGGRYYDRAPESERRYERSDSERSYNNNRPERERPDVPPAPAPDPQRQ